MQLETRREELRNASGLDLLHVLKHSDEVHGPLCVPVRGVNPLDLQMDARGLREKHERLQRSHIRQRESSC